LLWRFVTRSAWRAAARQIGQPVHRSAADAHLGDRSDCLADLWWRLLERRLHGRLNRAQHRSLWVLYSTGDPCEIASEGSKESISAAHAAQRAIALARSALLWTSCSRGCRILSLGKLSDIIIVTALFSRSWPSGYARSRTLHVRKLLARFLIEQILHRAAAKSG